MDTAMHSKRLWIHERAKELEVEVLLADGFDDAILGLVDLGDRTVVAYSIGRIIGQLVSEGLSFEEAYEHFDFNIAGAYLGPQTPVYVEDPCV